MDEQGVRERVREVVAEMAPFSDAAVAATSALVVDLGFDSLGVLECLGAIEHEFNLPDTDEGGISVETVADIEELTLVALWARGRLEDVADAR
jgi:acyl carrier protein